MTLVRISKIFILLIISVLVSTFSSCDKESKQTLPARNWTLVWSDEFNDNLVSSPKSSNWTNDIGTGTDGWGNKELQYYTDRLDVIATDGKGNLNIMAKKENLGGREYVSGRIQSKNKFSQKYGKIEARMKVPFGPGIWPAFWMMGSNVDTVSWPNCGEIDIMEMKGHEPSTIYGTLHGPGYSGGNPIVGSYSLKNDRFDNDFHIYGVEWFEDRIDFFVDGYLYQRVNKTDVPANKWVFDHPFFIIMNVAVGGNYVGFPNVNTAFPQSMQVDYVRVYK
jgi:beta-glucanase (GH16 family)